MGKLGWQPRSAVVELREADAEGMGARAVFEPCGAGRMTVGLICRAPSLAQSSQEADLEQSPPRKHCTKSH